MSYHGVLAYDNATVAIPTAEETAIVLGAEKFDTDAYHSLGANTERLTIPAGLDGIYRIYGHIRWESLAGGVRRVRVYKNGSVIILVEAHCEDQVVTPCSNFVTVAPLHEGDYIFMKCYQTCGVDLDTVGNVWCTYFGIDYLGEHA